MLLLVGTVVARWGGQGAPQAAAPAVPPVSGSPSVAATSSVPGVSTGPTLERSVTADPVSPGDSAVREVVAVAEDVVRAWQTPDEEGRAAALVPLVTSEYLLVAGTIDPTRVPQAPIQDAGLRTEADGQALVDVDLADGTALAVLLVLSETGEWVGADVLPVDAGDA